MLVSRRVLAGGVLQPAGGGAPELLGSRAAFAVAAVQPFATARLERSLMVQATRRV